MTYHDYPLTLEERLENAFLSFNKEEEVKAIIQEISFDAYSRWWEAHQKYQKDIQDAPLPINF